LVYNSVLYDINQLGTVAAINIPPNPINTGAYKTIQLIMKLHG